MNHRSLLQLPGHHSVHPDSEQLGQVGSLQHLGNQEEKNHSSCSLGDGYFEERVGEKMKQPT
jgi:hypothetical protein